MARVFGDLEATYLREVLDSGRLGWYHEKNSMTSRFEEAFAKKIGARFGVARNSCMTALAQAVAVSGAGTGSEVICDPLCRFAGIAALDSNAVPRFADVKYDTYVMDPASVRANITDRTKALIVTNLFGLCAELDEIREICNEHGIFMIEDCAHSIGSYWKGRHAGSYGDLGCFSFQQSKQLTTGDGGMMVTDREDLYYSLYHEWAFGQSPVFMTLNFRMNEVTAAVGMAQLQRVDGYLDEYGEGLRVMNEVIADCRWLRNRTVPEEAVQSGYIWACTWEGDKQGLDYGRFKQVVQELELPLGYGLNVGEVAYQGDIFKVSTVYGHPDCPTRCPFYESDYRYEDGLCPVAEDLNPRILMLGLVGVSEDVVKRRAELLHKAIEITEEG